MPSTVIVNNKTTQHKMSNGVTTAFPDVCKTPTPGGPVPIPYPNIAQSMMCSLKVTMRVKDNKMQVGVKGCSWTLSNGDEAGVALGVKSNKIMGMSNPKNQSFNTKFEKKGVARLGEPHGNNSMGQNSNGVAPGEIQPPLVGMGGKGDDDACKQLEKNHVPGDKQDEVALEYGMDPKHAKGIRETCAGSGRSVSFRSTNKESGKWIKKGHPAKGCDIPEKSISRDGTIPKLKDSADLDTIDKHGLEGLVGAYDGDGKLVGVRTTDGSVSFKDIEKNGKVPSNAYTGDYDAHDMWDADGSRIVDGSDAEEAFTEELNQGIGRGAGPENEMVRHGPQANYSKNVERLGKGEPHPIPGLQEPDLPVLAFDGNGEMYELKTKKDLELYYACKGAKMPPEWKEGSEEHKKVQERKKTFKPKPKPSPGVK